MIDEFYGEVLSLVRVITSKFHQQKPSSRGKKIQVLRSLSLEPVNDTSLKTLKRDRAELQNLWNVVGRAKRIFISQTNKRAILRARDQSQHGFADNRASPFYPHYRPRNVESSIGQELIKVI